MSQLCAVTKCNRVLRGLCDCCQQYLCLQHLNEHNTALISQLNPLTDQINELAHRLQSIDVQHIIDEGRRKLEQWRDDCRERIDRFFEQKCQELEQLVNEKVNEPREKLARLQTKMTELIHAQETTRQDIDMLTSTMQELVSDMDNIEQTCSSIHTRPLSIDETMISIKGMTNHELDLGNLLPAWKTMDRPDGSYASLASNDRYLLIHQQPYLCLLDSEMNIVNQTLWSYNAIYDMCWSSTLNRFIVIEENTVLLVEENTMTIDHVETIERGLWLSCSCSQTSLFLSTGERAASIMEYSLLPTIQLIREHRYPHTCTRDEVISDIVYNNEKLILIVMNIYEKSLRIELRTVDSLDRLWILQFDTVFDQTLAFRCCSLTCDEWLVCDYDKRYLLHITEDGKVKRTIAYDAVPYRANLFGNLLVVSVKGGTNFHRL